MTDQSTGAELTGTGAPAGRYRRSNRPEPRSVTVEVRTITGSTLHALELDAEIFGIQPNVAVMHQVVTAQLAAARRGTQSTLTRAEVRGGGKKPWRQKGTGRARQGSTRAPHWVGGGVALGPKPRSYKQHTPKKMVQLALRSALSDRAAEGKVAVVDAWSFAQPKTKEAVAALAALELTGKVLVVVSVEDEDAMRSFRNLPDAQLILDVELNAYDVLCNDWVVFTQASLPGSGSQKPAATPGEPEAAEVAAAEDEAGIVDQQATAVAAAESGTGGPGAEEES